MAENFFEESIGMCFPQNQNKLTFVESPRFGKYCCIIEIQTLQNNSQEMHL